MRAMTWWQFSEHVDGWVQANRPEKNDGLTPHEEDRLWEMVRAD